MSCYLYSSNRVYCIVYGDYSLYEHRIDPMLSIESYSRELYLFSMVSIVYKHSIV